MNTITYTGVLTTTHCGVCQIHFAIPQDLYDRCQNDSSKNFWCPNGHKLHYSTDDNERLRQELARANTRALRAQNEAEFNERSRRAVKGHLTRTKKRIANGVCPCCNRSFKDLARHMAGQHPDYVEA